MTRDQEVLDRLDRLEAMIGTMLRQRLSDKTARLLDEVRDRGRVSSVDAQTMLGCSRQHSLTLLERLSKQPGCRLIRGDRTQGRPTQLVFDASKILIDQHRRIDSLIHERGAATLADLMDELGVDLPAAKLVAQGWVAVRPGWALVGPKLERGGTP